MTTNIATQMHSAVDEEQEWTEGTSMEMRFTLIFFFTIIDLKFCDSLMDW